jgi:thiamine kinase-like enzyme
VHALNLAEQTAPRNGSPHSPYSFDGVMPIAPEDVLHRIALHDGRMFKLLGPLSGGEVGGSFVEDSDGRKLVLKCWDDVAARPRAERLVARIARLRALGYPAPHYEQVIEVAGVVVLLQEVMPGEANNALTHTIVDDLLALHGLHDGLGEKDASWQTDKVRLLVEGGNGYCLHEPLRAHSRDTRRLLDCIEEVGRNSAGLAFPSGDVVHTDFHHLNVLVAGGRVTSVIDWDGSCSGDRAFDLVTLAYGCAWGECERGVEERLWAAVDRATTPDVRTAYLAVMSLRLVDWSIRHHPAGSVDFWLRRSERLLPGLARR